MNNIIIDLYDKIKIPQNEKKFFIIEKHKEWKSSIVISFDYWEFYNEIYLYFILKSYINYKEFQPYLILTAIGSKNKIITQKDRIDWLKKQDFESFCNWIKKRIEMDEKYNNEENKECIYNIILIYSKSLNLLKNKELNTEITEKMKPIYPWKKEWIDEFKKEIDTISILKEKIKTLEDELKKK